MNDHTPPIEARTDGAGLTWFWDAGAHLVELLESERVVLADASDEPPC